jgi:hypothetical protein
MQLQKVKVNTLFDKFCKKADDVNAPKVISNIAYVVSTETTKLIVKGLLYSLLMIL